VDFFLPPPSGGSRNIFLAFSGAQGGDGEESIELDVTLGAGRKQAAAGVGGQKEAPFILGFDARPCGSLINVELVSGGGESRLAAAIGSNR
jgi:hypothetical protein